MNYPQNIRQVFAPLGARLYMFESKMYIDDFAEYESPVDWVDRMETTYNYNLMYQIGRLVNAFDPREVIAEALFYDNRILKLLDEIKPREWDYEMRSGNPVKVEIDESHNEEQFEIWKGELLVYRYQLQQLRNARSEYLDVGEKDKLKEETIPYPTAQFEILKLNEITTRSTVAEFINFKQELTPQQIALFMHYLIHVGVMPPYNAASVGRLTKYFFARSDKSRASYNPISLDELKGDSDNLEKIESTFSLLLKLVTNDIDNIGLR